MNETLERVRTGAVAPAARDDAQGRFREGDAVGFVEEEIVAWGRPRETLRGVLERLAENAELITCLRGAEAPLDDATVQALAAGEVEFELSTAASRATGGCWPLSDSPVPPGPRSSWLLERCPPPPSPPRARSSRLSSAGAGALSAAVASLGAAAAAGSQGRARRGVARAC